MYECIEPAGAEVAHERSEVGIWCKTNTSNYGIWHTMLEIPIAKFCVIAIP